MFILYFKKIKVRYLISQNVIQPLCKMLTARDVQVIQVALDGISNILKAAGPHLEEVTNSIEACGGLNLIEELQSNANEVVFNLAYGILANYYASVGTKYTIFAERVVGLYKRGHFLGL